MVKGRRSPLLDQIATPIIQMISRSKSLPTEMITPASTFEALGMDSLDKINLTFEIEEAFKISIPDESLHSLRTVGDIIEGVQRLQAEQAA